MSSTAKKKTSKETKKDKRNSEVDVKLTVDEKGNPKTIKESKQGKAKREGSKRKLLGKEFGTKDNAEAKRKAEEAEREAIRQA